MKNIFKTTASPKLIDIIGLQSVGTESEAKVSAQKSVTDSSECVSQHRSSALEGNGYRGTLKPAFQLVVTPSPWFLSII